MDKNKLKVLQDINYKIPKQCGLCKHGAFPASQDFGVCSLQTYVHLKHSAPISSLSIWHGGQCEKFEPDPEEIAKLHGFVEFVADCCPDRLIGQQVSCQCTCHLKRGKP